jgi:hypothetical protein
MHQSVWRKIETTEEVNFLDSAIDELINDIRS